MAAEKMGRDGLEPLHVSDTRSHAPMDSETFKKLAGRAKWLSEMATGAPAGDAAHEPTTLLNPSGRLGHDHSGPPYGSALQHPIFTYSTPKVSSDFVVAGAGGDEYGDRQIVASSSKSPRLVADVRVRPFPVYEGTPYGRAYLYVMALATATETLNVKMWNASIGGADAVYRTDSVSVTTTAWPPAWIEFSTAYWDIQPGRNRLAVDFSITGSNTTTIYSVSGNQIVKRTH